MASDRSTEQLLPLSPLQTEAGMPSFSSFEFDDDESTWIQDLSSYKQSKAAERKQELDRSRRNKLQERRKKLTQRKLRAEKNKGKTLAEIVALGEEETNISVSFAPATEKKVKPPNLAKKLRR